ncbi:MAG: sulfur carrier protein ThiS adenylyltransferase ThiF [Bacteroidales bacterium]|jgi:sulfur carrier protein ThiS adenylyltransferase|nr:sulfur carrier protein ThiS adenylyltransferase ThiF [Bacteroidales bacterium]
MTFEEIKEKLAHKRVGIAGCGGLGSNCAVALARVGIGTLVIVDFDVISESNLNRQYFFFDQIGLKKVLALKENIGRINPMVKVYSSDVKLVPDNIALLFNGCDVIVEAFDQSDQKEMFIETVLADLPSIPLVIGLGMAGWGRNESIHCRKIDNLYICGDEVSEIGPDMPPIAPRVGMVSNMQANVVLEILLGIQ